MTWWRDREEFEKRWIAADYNLCALADSHNMSRSTTTQWKARHGLEYPDSVNPKGNTREAVARNAAPPPPLIPIEEEEIRVDGDAGLSSDWHLPLTCWDTFRRWLEACYDAGITTGICAGDMFNFDRWSRHEESQAGTSPVDDLDSGVYAVREALTVFDKLYVARGNHDMNMARKLDFGVKFDRVVRMALAGLDPSELAKLSITGRDYVIVDTDEGEWRVCHTYSYSRQPLAYPNRVAVRHNQHVAAGHRHHHAQGFAANGKRLVELGGFMDEERMAYTKRFTNDFPMMNKGFALLRDGRADCPMLR